MLEMLEMLEMLCDVQTDLDIKRKRYEGNDTAKRGDAPSNKMKMKTKYQKKTPANAKIKKKQL